MLGGVVIQVEVGLMLIGNCISGFNVGYLIILFKVGVQGVVVVVLLGFDVGGVVYCFFYDGVR